MFNNNNHGLRFYDPTQVAQQFSQLSFGFGSPYDQLTTQVAQMVVAEIQNRASSGHPIRVAMFNFISNSAFNNGDFQFLLRTVITRAVYGLQAVEYRDLSQAFSDVVVRCVKAMACGLSSTDPAFVQSLSPDDQTGVREGSALWSHLMALVNGQASYVPFNQMALNNQLSNVNDATRAANEAFQNINSNAGNFTGTTDYSVGTTGGNNLSADLGRYGRRLGAQQGILEGSMQTAFQAVSDNQPKYQPRFTSVSAVTDVTDFTKSISEPAAEAPKAPEPAAVAITPFTVQLGEKVHHLVREYREGGMEKWKPSEVQRFHPAWCKRTHTVRYFETTEGVIIVIAQILNEEQRKIAMDYKAHAIDPSKGQPDPEIPKAPVREEAKVLYSKETTASVKVIISEKITTVENLDAGIRRAQTTGQLTNPVPDVYVDKAAIATPLVYEFDTEAHDDKLVITAISASKTFTEAAKLLSKLVNPLAREAINKQLTHAINTACACELAVEVKIDSFEEDAAVVIDAIEGHYGALYGEALRQKQAHILFTNVICLAASDIPNYAEKILNIDIDDEEEVKKLDKILFLSHNVMFAWTKYTDDELAIGVPNEGSAQIQEDTYSALYQVAKAIFDNVSDTSAYVEFYLVTKDNVRYRLHRSLISKNCYLISKQFKEVS